MNQEIKRKFHLFGILILIGATLLILLCEGFLIILSFFSWTNDLLIVLGGEIKIQDYINFIFSLGSFISFIHYFKLVRNIKYQETAKDRSLPLDHCDDQKKEKTDHHNVQEGQENTQEFKKKKEKKKKQKPRLEIKDGKVVQQKKTKK